MSYTLHVGLKIACLFEVHTTSPIRAEEDFIFILTSLDQLSSNLIKGNNFGFFLFLKNQIVLMIPEYEVIESAFLNLDQRSKVLLNLSLSFSLHERNLTSWHNFRKRGSAMFINFSQQLHRVLDRKRRISKDFIPRVQVFHVERDSTKRVKANISGRLFTYPCLLYTSPSPRDS